MAGPDIKRKLGEMVPSGARQELKGFDNDALDGFVNSIGSSNKADKTPELHPISVEVGKAVSAANLGNMPSNDLESSVSYARIPKDGYSLVVTLDSGGRPSLLPSSSTDLDMVAMAKPEVLFPCENLSSEKGCLALDKNSNRCKNQTLSTMGEYLPIEPENNIESEEEEEEPTRMVKLFSLRLPSYLTGAFSLLSENTPVSYLISGILNCYDIDKIQSLPEVDHQVERFLEFILLQIPEDDKKNLTNIFTTDSECKEVFDYFLQKYSDKLEAIVPKFFTTFGSINRNQIFAMVKKSRQGLRITVRQDDDIIRKAKNLEKLKLEVGELNWSEKFKLMLSCFWPANKNSGQVPAKNTASHKLSPRSLMHSFTPARAAVFGFATLISGGLYNSGATLDDGIENIAVSSEKSDDNEVVSKSSLLVTFDESSAPKDKFDMSVLQSSYKTVAKLLDESGNMQLTLEESNKDLLSSVVKQFHAYTPASGELSVAENNERLGRLERVLEFARVWYDFFAYSERAEVFAFRQENSDLFFKAGDAKVENLKRTRWKERFGNDVFRVPVLESNGTISFERFDAAKHGEKMKAAVKFYADIMKSFNSANQNNSKFTDIAFTNPGIIYVPEIFVKICAGGEDTQLNTLLDKKNSPVIDFDRKREQPEIETTELDISEEDLIAEFEAANEQKSEVEIFPAAKTKNIIVDPTADNFDIWEGTFMTDEIGANRLNSTSEFASTTTAAINKFTREGLIAALTNHPSIKQWS